MGLPYDPDTLKTLAVSDSGFIFDPRTGHTYNMNATAAATLKALREGATVAEVAAKLRDTFDGGGAVEEDVEAFLSRLRDYGLLPATTATPEAL